MLKSSFRSGSERAFAKQWLAARNWDPECNIQPPWIYGWGYAASSHRICVKPQDLFELSLSDHRYLITLNNSDHSETFKEILWPDAAYPHPYIQGVYSSDRCTKRISCDCFCITLPSFNVYRISGYYSSIQNRTTQWAWLMFNSLTTRVKNMS